MAYRPITGAGTNLSAVLSPPAAALRTKFGQSCVLPDFRAYLYGVLVVQRYDLHLCAARPTTTAPRRGGDQALSKQVEQKTYRFSAQSGSGRGLESTQFCTRAGLDILAWSRAPP